MREDQQPLRSGRTSHGSFNGREITTRDLDPEGPTLITLSIHHDDRGSFMESWNMFTYQAIGLPLHWPQDNVSHSKKGVIRGMHFQHNNPQGKLISCVRGMIQDVCIDLRSSSPAYGKSYSVILRDDKPELLYVPPGFAHGFLALEQATLHYKCTTIFDPDSSHGLNPFQCGVEWKSKQSESLTVSEQDRGRPSLIDYLKGRR